MADRTLVIASGLSVALVSAASFAQTASPDRAASLPRTPDGHPDLQGIWDFRSATPLERPARFVGREFMTCDEVVESERLALEGNYGLRDILTGARYEERVAAPATGKTQ